MNARDKASDIERSIYAGQKDSIGVLMRSLKERAKWPWMREHLKMNEFKPGSGWSNIEGTISGHDDVAQTMRQLVTDYYNQIVFAGYRYVQIFDLHLDIWIEIEQKLSGATISNTPEAKYFPYLLPESELLSTSTEPTICNITKFGDDYCLAFSSKQEYTEKTILDEKSKKASKLDGYDEIVALKKKYFQAIDIVAFRPRLKRLEILVDLPIVYAQGLDRAERALKLLFAVADYIPAFRQIANGQFPINIFPAIDGIYRNNTGGKLQEVRLRTETGLIDNLKTVIDGDNLRIAKYHTEGAKTINGLIEPFEVITRLDLSFPKSDVLLKLASPVRVLANPPDNRTLVGMELLECRSQADAVHAINRVVSFLS